MQSNSQIKKRRKHIFDRLSSFITKATGSSAAFIIALSVIVIWGISGPFFNYSNTWQLVINTGTTVITFLMVFIIQQSQNKETMAVQLKLNELIASSEKATNRLIDVEDLTEDELKLLKTFYIKLSGLAAKENDLHKSHSLDEVSEYTNKSRLQKKGNK
jgi:low affinity Fe/Cu permease